MAKITLISQIINKLDRNSFQKVVKEQKTNKYNNIIELDQASTSNKYPKKLRRVVLFLEDKNETLEILTNNFIIFVRFKPRFFYVLLLFSIYFVQL